MREKRTAAASSRGRSSAPASPCPLPGRVDTYRVQVPVRLARVTTCHRLRERGGYAQAAAESTRGPGQGAQLLGDA